MSGLADRIHPDTAPTPVLSPAVGGRPGLRRFRRRRPTRDDGAHSGHEVLAELVLLREENARLKAAEHEPPSFGRLLARARALHAANVPHEEFGDEAVQALVEVVVLRDSLLEVCQELEHSMAAVRVRLNALADAGDGVGHGAGDV